MNRCHWPCELWNWLICTCLHFVSRGR